MRKIEGTLEGKRALVTGGTSGIGLETALQFIDAGARVIVTGWQTDSIARASARLGSGVVVLRADAASAQGHAAVAAAVREHLGGLDAVFVNAGVGEFRPLAGWDEAGYDRLFGTNLKGPFFLLRALLPLLADPCSVVLNASVNAHIGVPGSSVYAASKAGLLALARTLSGELANRGVRVNAISPGPVDTPIYSKLGLDDASLAGLADALRARSPLHRFGQPAEVAQAAVFLASDASSYMLGSEMVVDGGFSTV